MSVETPVDYAGGCAACGCCETHYDLLICKRFGRHVGDWQNGEWAYEGRCSECIDEEQRAKGVST